MSQRDSFGSRFGILAAAVGSAVGLGNIWKFPYMAGENGGGAFLLIYFVCIVLLGVPLMTSEFVIGRRGQRNAFGSFKKLAQKSHWPLVGVMGVVAAFAILSFYSVVAGWTLEYIVATIGGSLAKIQQGQMGDYFANFIDNPVRIVLWQLVFMVLTALIVAGGVKKGIERYSKLLMPMLFLLLIVMGIRAILLPNSAEGLKFMFYPDFSKVSVKTVLFALGQAFFSLSLGMGTLITYASYFNKEENLARTALNVSIADTLVAILAGVVIFPAVFSFGIAPSSGPSLVFITLPEIFRQMPMGGCFQLLFFLLLAVAALTSTVSVLEVVVAYFSEEFNLPRKKATWIAAASISVVGVLAALSFGPLKDVSIFGKNIFDSLDFTASNVLLPLGGLLIVVFVAWFMKPTDVRSEITNNGKLKSRFYPIYRFVIKFVAPVAIATILVYSIFVGSLG